MATLRRYALLALSMAVTLAMTAAPAHADVAEVFGGTGSARALHLSVLGKDVTLGAAGSTVGSTLTAAANAAGQLLQPGSSSSVSLNRDNSAASDPNNGSRHCALPSLPAPVASLLTADLACSLAKADITAGVPHALGQASVASISLQANTLLKSITDKIPLQPTIDQVKQNLAPVIDAVSKATGNAVDLDKTTATVTDLLTALTTQKTLQVDLGQSTSELATVASATTSTSSARGASIELLPIVALNNTPLATITVGSATANAVYDRVKGVSSASFDPALVTVQLASIAGLPGQTIKVAPGQTITLFPGTPLESTIIVADGHTDSGTNSAKAVADGVSLHLLKGLSGVGSTGVTTAAAGGDGAVVLELAHAEAQVNGTPASVVPPTPANPQVPTAPAVKALAFTGTSPWLPVAGFALIGGAVGMRRLRRRVNTTV